jgi:ectoine hydroxylase-related dioxygenase (phytanoyl-CoA dioxygenase family)
MALTTQQIRRYEDAGFIVVSRLFDQETIQGMIDHYMKLRAEGPKPGDFGGTADQPDDPTHKYPRMINMHNWDEKSKRWAMQLEMLEIVEQLIKDKPVLQQTMIYFKPPGGRGQALHQDQQYITIEPLIGVWVALDKSDKAVGQMTVVPGSHKLGLADVQEADTSISFTDVQTVLPKDAEQLGVDMEPGDALFFHGKAIHGSYTNVTRDRWRRSFICHYIGEHAERFTPPQGKHVSHVRKPR